MEFEIVTVGDELLLGQIQDTNSTRIASIATGIGMVPARCTAVGDDHDDIRAAVADALGRVDLVVTTGGLGPTVDDITKKAVAAVFDRELELDEDYLAHLERMFAGFRRGPMPRSNVSQAYMPAGAEIVRNKRGSAPGLWLTDAGKHVVMLPGVPHEMLGILRDELLPLFRERFALGDSVTLSRVLRTTGIGESALADRLDGFDREIGDLGVAYLPTRYGVDLRLTAWSMNEALATERLDEAACALKSRLKRYCYGEGDTDLAAVVVDLLRAGGRRLAVAESCTGGLIGGRLTEVPGASDVFLGGIVSYADSVKAAQLAVSPDTLAETGAVSEEVAAQMAIGVAAALGADVAVSVTGIAGPGGGSEHKPVGTVFISVWNEGSTDTARLQFPGERQWVRARSAQEALNRVRLTLAE